jgi:hypothetical protein
VKREFFKQSMEGTVQEGMSEEEFTKSVWDRALFEGDLKFRQMNGEATDVESELADFKSRQERKKQAMLKRAKEEMKEILEEEDLLSDDLEATFASMDASADNTED